MAHDTIRDPGRAYSPTFYCTRVGCVTSCQHSILESELLEVPFQGPLGLPPSSGPSKVIQDYFYTSTSPSWVSSTRSEPKWNSDGSSNAIPREKSVQHFTPTRNTWMVNMCTTRTPDPAQLPQTASETIMSRPMERDEGQRDSSLRDTTSFRSAPAYYYANHGRIHT